MSFRRIQNEDVKNASDLTGAGGTIAQLINDSKIYVSANALDKTLEQAIIDGDIGGGSEDLKNLFQNPFFEEDSIDGVTELNFASTQNVTGGIAGANAREVNFSADNGIIKIEKNVPASYAGNTVKVSFRGKAGTTDTGLVVNFLRDGNIIETVDFQVLTEFTSYGFFMGAGATSIGFSIVNTDAANTGTILIDDVYIGLGEPTVEGVDLFQEITLVNSGAQNMNGTILVSRVGSQVSISALDEITHDLSSDPESSSILPAWAIPLNAKSNIYNGFSNNIQRITVFEDGSIRFSYRTNTATLQLTTAGVDFTISYNVSDSTSSKIISAEKNVYFQKVQLVNSGANNINGELAISRVGSQVTISALNEITHDLSSDALSDSILPAWAIPLERKSNAFRSFETDLKNIIVFGNGAIRFSYRTSTASLQLTTAGVDFTISYNVDDGASSLQLFNELKNSVNNKLVLVSGGYTDDSNLNNTTINVDAATATINLNPSLPVGYRRLVRKTNATQGAITIQATGETFTRAGLSSVALNANGDYWLMEKVSSTRWELLEGRESGSNAGGDYFRQADGYDFRSRTYTDTFPIGVSTYTVASALTSTLINGRFLAGWGGSIGGWVKLGCQPSGGNSWFIALEMTSQNNRTVYLTAHGRWYA